MVQEETDPVTHRTIFDVDKNLSTALSPTEAAYRSAGRDSFMPHRKGLQLGGVKNSFKYMTVSAEH